MPRGTRNPYEIRFDTLTLAKDILSGNASAQRESNRDRRTDIDAAPNNVDDGENADHGLYDPYTFSTQAVITAAHELYAFVDPESDTGDTPPPPPATHREAGSKRGGQGAAGRSVRRPEDLRPEVNGPDTRPTLSALQEASGLPGDSTPATHPAANARVTILNDPDLHVSLDKHANTVHVWFEDHLYCGDLTFPTSKCGEVRGIFPDINDPKILNRVEAGLTKYQRGPIKLRFKDETEFPPTREATLIYSDDNLMVTLEPDQVTNSHHYQDPTGPR